MSKKKPVIENIPENITSAVLDEIMGDRYSIYAKDVIQDRAIPDARDGMKPVQRRIIYYMCKTGNTIDKPTKKCAHIVGGVMGQYHPHGDSSIYEALVRMSQTWSVRAPLIDFQGNNGSMDGDGAAAYRYTEARLSALSNELVSDIDKDTVDMALTFDDVLTEPTVLPARFPNLLVNGAEGIAVGMATHIPPHNLKEVVNAICYRIKHRDCDVDALLRYVEGPDFPTGGIILGSDEVKNLYRVGRAHLNLTSKAEIVVNEEGTKQIIVSEIPYGVVKSQLVYGIDKLRHDKVISGIDEVRDETDKNGLRIAIDLKDDAKAETILAYLKSKSSGKGGLSSTYSANMVAIVNGRPKTMDLVSYCDCYIAHQEDVIRRRSHFDLSKNTTRLSLVEGLIHAISILDEVVKIIHASKDKADSKANLQKAFGFSEPQSEAIVMMPLYKLSNTDVSILIKEKDLLSEEIKKLNLILSDESVLTDLIVRDLKDVSKKFGDARRTEILGADQIEETVIEERDLIAEQDVYVALSKDGYLKRSSVKSFKGSGGDKGNLPGIKKGDALVFRSLCKTTDFLLVFTSKGNYLYIPVNEIKDIKWLDEGAHVNSMVTILPDEKMVRAFAVKDFTKGLYCFLLSRKGFAKRIPLELFPVVRRNRAIGAMKLGMSDELVEVLLTTGNSNVFVASENGNAIVYNENEVSPTNPKSGGIKAGSFKGNPLVDGMAFTPTEPTKAILITNLGCSRVIEVAKLGVSTRLGKTTPLYPMFKNEPHSLLISEKILSKALPYEAITVLESGERKAVVFNDFYLTPSEKYVKRPSNFLKKDPISSVFRDDDLRVDESFLPLEPEVDTSVSVAEEDTEVKPEEPLKAFEQISLFDDDDESN